MTQERYTLTYRAVEARQVMGWIKTGQSGCIIGLRGAGKSNFLRFLLHQDVRQYYLGQGYVDYVFVLVDVLALVELTEWAIYELVLDRLLDQLHPLGIEEETIEELTSLHQEITRAKDPLIAQRAVKRGIDVVCKRPGGRIALLFDEFDPVFRTLDPSLFRNLRATRDGHKGQVSYTVVVTGELADQREDLAAVEHFYRLVSRNVCELGPYGQEDARVMLSYLASQRSVELSEEDTARLLELSGGHAGLLKAILSQLWDVHREDSLDELAPTLIEEPVVQAECGKVWASLPEREQAALWAIVAGAPADPHTLRCLERKGLAREDRPGPLIFSPLFADFVRQQTPPATKGVVVSRSPRSMQIDGQRVESLTELEFETLCYLYEHRGRVCTKDELIQNVYGQRYDRMEGGISDAALQTLIARLRAKIEPDRGRPRYIITVREEGYRFNEGNTTTN